MCAQPLLIVRLRQAFTVRGFSLSKSKILYITRNGMLEPLGQSQVLSYLRGLAEHYQISLVSFEKPEDLNHRPAVDRVAAQCQQHGIRWLPQRFNYRPRVIAPAWSMLVFLFICLREVRKGNADIIHARSYIPAAVALLVHKLTRTPFIFDMRALWPEELITAGRLQRDSLMHKAIVWVERSCLRNAAAVVSLTHAAVTYLQQQYPQELAAQKLVVIPTCADLERFVPQKLSAEEAELGPVYSCVGTVLSGWFHLDWLALFFQAVADRDSQARFEIITRDDIAAVRQHLGGGAEFQARVRIFALPAHEVHSAVQQHDVSAMFFTQGVSKLGSSPTRMGEVLGCGLPVVANSGVGDVARIIEQYRVGVLVDEGTPMAMAWAAEEIAVLKQDPELSVRCRRAAEEVFSLESGTQTYKTLYQHVLGR